MDRLLTANEVLTLTGYKSRSTLWRKVRGRAFPPPVKLDGVAIRWKEGEVRTWIEDAPIQSYGTKDRSA